jgi:hypothetical protein
MAQVQVGGKPNPRHVYCLSRDFGPGRLPRRAEQDQQSPTGRFKLTRRVRPRFANPPPSTSQVTLQALSPEGVRRPKLHATGSMVLASNSQPGRTARAPGTTERETINRSGSPDLRSRRYRTCIRVCTGEDEAKFPKSVLFRPRSALPTRRAGWNCALPVGTSPEGGNETWLSSSAKKPAGKSWSLA